MDHYGRCRHRHGLAVTLALALLLVGVSRPAATQQAAPGRPFDRLFNAYASGDFGVVHRTLKTPADYETIRKDLLSAMDRWRDDWRPIQAVFLLDVLEAAFTGHWMKSPDLLASVTDFVKARSRGVRVPNRAGSASSASLDDFEVLWHKTAMALLQKHLRALDVETYLKAVDNRITPRPRDDRDGRLVEPHLALSRAIGFEQMCTPDTIAFYQFANVAPLAIGPLRGPNAQLVAKNVEAALTGPALTAALKATSGNTTLLDAIAMSLVIAPEPGRRQMAIVFTDGRDNLSILTESSVIEVAKRSGLAVFAVAAVATPAPVPGGFFRPSGPPASSSAPHAPLFRALAELSGGQFIALTRDQDLSAPFVQAFDAFRSSYVLRYTVQGVARAGWHAIEIKVTRPGAYDVRARKGYFGS